MDRIELFSASAAEWWPTLVLGALAVVFLVLWLRARSRGGSDLRQQLRAAQNEVRLLKGDAIQARREHATQLERTKQELETLRALAEGRVPPELEQWKQRALDAEKKLESELQRHRAEIEKVLAAVGTGSVDQTMIAPGGARERAERLEQELAAARQELEAATKRYEADLAGLVERLNAEKAAALTAQARRHAAEMEALQSGRPAAHAADEHRPEPAMPAAEPDLPESARYPFLHGLKGAGQGLRFYLPYDVATIGRSEVNTVVLQETMASRVHAEIRFDGVDFTITDRNSTNGTFLNDELLTNAPLAFGDVIRIGGTELRFTCEAAEAAEHDPEFAKLAFRAMLRLAPKCRPALLGLAGLLEQYGHADQVRALAAQLGDLNDRRASGELKPESEGPAGTSERPA